MTTTTALSRRLIQRLPKTDLHVHLDGSMRMNTLIELAKKQAVSLPSYTVEGLCHTVFKKKYRNLSDYLQGFAYTCAVLRDAQTLQRVAYELAQDCLAEGVCYLEVRLAPQLHVRSGLSIARVLQAVNTGLQQAAQEHAASESVQLHRAPMFRFGILVCAMRMFHAGFGPYYRHVLATARGQAAKQIYVQASLQLVRQAVIARDRLGIPIVGLDLAGLESGYPAKHHHEAYTFARSAGLRVTVHAGEAFGVASIEQALYRLQSHRIGHATHLYRPDDWQHSVVNTLSDAMAPSGLRSALRRQQVPLEVCVSSNVQTLSWVRGVQDHPVQHMLRDGLAVTVCTDNRLISHTCVTDELFHICKTFRLTLRQLRDLVLCGFSGSFFPDTCYQKRLYIQQVASWCDRLLTP